MVTLTVRPFAIPIVRDARIATYRARMTMNRAWQSPIGTMRGKVFVSSVILGIVATTAGCSTVQQDSLASSPSSSDITSTLGQLDAIAEDALKRTGVPGAAVAVVQGDKVVYTKGYGLREVGKPDPVDADTVFQLASLSKSIGSTVVSGIVGAGKASWDDPITKWLPTFALSDPWVTKNVTIADMYAHRSGLPGDSGNDLEAMGYDQAEILKRLRFEPLGPFRNQYSYSNFGLTSGGVAAATADGTTFADAAQYRLFKPAGMTSSSYRYSDYLSQSNKALIHSKVNGKYEAAFTREPDAQDPAGGASSNATDLAQWLRIELNEGKLGDKPIVPAEALDRAHRPVIDNRPGTPVTAPANFYGLGWNVGLDDRNQVMWSHSGAFSQGAGTTVRVFPNQKLGIIVLTNGPPVGAAEAIADAYADVVLQGSAQQDWVKVWGDRLAPLLAPSQPTPPASVTSPAALTSYEGTYSNPYYGDFVVTAQGSDLVMTVGPHGAKTYILTPFNGNEFLFDFSPEIPQSQSPIVFAMGADGKATALVLGPDPKAEGLVRLPRTK